MEKFHHFLYASHFILERDKKPLETILSKSLNKQHQSYKEFWSEHFLITSLFTIYQVWPISLQTACHRWETKKIPFNSLNYKYTRSHNNYQQTVTAYISSDYQCKLMMNLFCWSTPLCKAGPSQLNKYPQSYNLSWHLERN